MRELEHDGIVIRTVHHEVPPKVMYTIDPGEEKPLRVLSTAMCERADYWALPDRGDNHPSGAGSWVVPRRPRNLIGM